MNSPLRRSARRPVRTAWMAVAGAAAMFVGWQITTEWHPKIFPSETEAKPAPLPARSVAVHPFTSSTRVRPRDETPPAVELPAPAITLESVEELAAQNPQRALALALAETDPEQRAELLQAAVRGWASMDGDAASAWARSQSYLDTGLALAAVFRGASRDPEKAEQLYRRLSVEDPDNALSYGSYLVFALGKNEQFDRAAKIAAESAPENRTDLLTAAYRTWAVHDSKAALADAIALKDVDSSRAAFQATIGGWADANPQELTELAITLPEGPDRKLALTTALRSWIEKDPAAAAAWAAKARPFPEMEATLEE